MSNAYHPDTGSLALSVPHQTMVVKYPAPDWLHNPTFIPSPEALNSVPKHYRTYDGVSVREMTDAEKLAWDNGTGLPLYKAAKIRSIDNKTEALIAQGFLWGNEVFSLSTNAQLKWTGLRLALQTGDLGPQDFPMTVANKSDSLQYLIADKFEAENMYKTAVGTVKAHIGSGEALKQQIRDATTKAALDLVIDNR